MKKWRAICIICILFILGINATTIKGQEMSSISNPSKELIVLVDSSGTMEGEKWERAIEWMKEICALGNIPEMKISFICFDSSINQEIDNSNKQVSMNMLDTLVKQKPSGKTTDLFTAMDWAINRMNHSNAKDKCIVMLSDAQLDLKGREKGKYDLEPSEIKSMEKFKSIVRKFNKEKNQFVVLVEFDAKENEMCVDGEPRYIFKELRDNDGIMYFGWEKEEEEAIRKIFEKLNYPISIKTKKDCDNNEINFKITEEFYRIIINLYNNTEEINEKQINELQIVYVDDKTKEEIPIVIDDSLVSSTSAFLYLNEPKHGEYTIKLPNGQWQYSIIEQTEVKIEDIELVVIQDNKVIEREKNNTQTDYSIFNITNEEFYVGFANQEKKYKKSNLKISYYIESVLEIGDSKLNIDKSKFISKESFDDIVEDYLSIKIEQLGENKREDEKIATGCYVCFLKICSGNKVSYIEPIWIQIEENPNIRLEPIESEVNKGIKWKELIDEQQADTLRVVYIHDANKNLIGEVGEDGEVINKQDIVSVKSNIITFLKAGEYELRMEGENIKIYQDIIIVENEKVPETIGFWEKIKACWEKWRKKLGLCVLGNILSKHILNIF